MLLAILRCFNPCSYGYTNIQKSDTIKGTAFLRKECVLAWFYSSNANRDFLLHYVQILVLCDILDEPHEDGRHLGAGGVVLGQEFAVGAADDALCDGPLQRRLCVTADLSGIGEAAQAALPACVDPPAAAVAVQNRCHLLPGMNRMRMVATWARVALSWGRSLPLEPPMMPSATVHCSAVFA